MNDVETKREKIELAILSRLQRERRLRAAVNVLKPLIERARVPRRLRDAALAKAPNGVERAELVAFGTEEDVAAVLSKLEGNRMVRVNAEGKYEAALEAACELSQKEAAKFAAKILADWPEEVRARVVNVFEHDEKEDDEEDD